jgi:hypothetical protein
MEYTQEWETALIQFRHQYHGHRKNANGQPQL